MWEFWGWALQSINTFHVQKLSVNSFCVFELADIGLHTLYCIGSHSVARIMKSFTCCKCSTKIPRGINGLFIHMKCVHLISTSTCTKLVCAEHNCSSCWRGSTYKRHLETIHNEIGDQEEQNDDERQEDLLYPRCCTPVKIVWPHL